MKIRYKIILIVFTLLIVNMITWFFYGDQKICQEQYEKILKYTPYLIEHWWDDIYVLIENSSMNGKVALPEYGLYHPIIIYDLDSVRNSQNNHLLIIDNIFYNPFYNKVNTGYWWLGTDAVSDYKATYIWCFFDWICINSDIDIKNHINKILYKTPIIFGNTPNNIETKFGKPNKRIKKTIYDKEIELLVYDGLQIEGWTNLSGFYHDESILFQITKISVTNSGLTRDLPFQIGGNISKAIEFLEDKFIVSKNDSILIFEKPRDDFDGYENHKFIIRFKDGVIKEFEWIYGEPYNLSEDLENKEISNN